jgi:hypothetical protein
MRTSENSVMRLSEKVHEQRPERGFGRYTEREEDLRVLCSGTLQAPPTLFGQSHGEVRRIYFYALG